MPQIIIPKIKKIQKPDSFEFRQERIHDVDLYIIPATNTLELVKIEIVLDRGRFDEEKRLSSRFCARMLKEGTSSRNNDDINDIFDFYGASFNVQYNLDFASFSLVCMKKYCLDLLPLIFEIITSPVFDPKELTLLKKKAKSKLKISLANNDSLSFREITEQIFGPEHPYGYNSIAEDIEAISKNDLRQFHTENYCRPFFKIYMAGNADKDIYEEITRQIETLPARYPGTKTASLRKSEPSGLPELRYLKNQYAFDTQSAIKMGKEIVKRDHPDFIPLHFLNTLLGGFFGSRLMQNIREDQGLTYNIYSDLEPMKYGAYFIIGTEVKTENIQKVIHSIHQEIEILENELAEEAELSMVRNYIKGYLLSSLDGVFSKMEMIKILTLENMEIQWIFDFFDRLSEIQSEDIPGLVKKYLKRAELFSVVVN